MKRDANDLWALVAILLIAAGFVWSLAREFALMSRPEKIIDRTHVQTRDGKIYVVLESHEP